MNAATTPAGLSAEEADARLRKDGPNELPGQKRRSLVLTAVHALREPMLLLLVIAGGLYLALGELRDALAMCAVMSVVIVITIVQQRKTENALAALRELSSPRARVIREGSETSIPAREVVRGDLVQVTEGDRVPADGLLRAAHGLEIDESLLTGESLPVHKQSTEALTHAAEEGGAASTYSGTLVVRGRGRLLVTRTGPFTEMGRIGQMLATVEVGRTPLQKQITRLVYGVSAVGAVACIGVAVGVGLSSARWLDGLLAGVAIAMSLLPEEFPVVLTAFFALGAWRLSRVRVLTRRMPTLETLGSTTVLCADKTGTLTQNRMSVAALQANDDRADLSPTDTELVPGMSSIVEFGILASQPASFDPMELAFFELGERMLGGVGLEGWKLVREYPLSSELMAMSHVWSKPSGEHLVATKGAPEAVAKLCRLSPEALEQVQARVEAMAVDGLRVLAVARGNANADQLPETAPEFDLEMVGLVGFADPVRPRVPAAVAECRSAGIRILMITGDYVETAKAIGRQAGLDQTGDAILGDQLVAKQGKELRAALEKTTIVSRAVPEHKLRIVQALREAGEIVAMTGDGVNDAPALKAAHVGVAMGGRGTDVAREASALVVTDDDFASIVAGIRSGRRIQNNLRRALAYVLAVHVPIAGMALGPILFGWPLMLLPIHIAFLELIIDPACSLAFEAEPADPNIMQRPPRPARLPLFGRDVIGWSLLQGLSVLIASGAVLWWASSQGFDLAQQRAIAFTTLIAGNLALILVNRSWSESFLQSMRRRNLAAVLVIVGAAVFLGLALGVPWLRDLFHFEEVPAAVLFGVSGVGLVSLAWFEFAKRFRRTRLVA